MIPHQLTVPRLLIALSAQPCTPGRSRITASSGVPSGVVWGGGVNHPPRISEDIGGVLDRMSKNRRLDILLQFTVFSYGCNLLNKGFF